MKTERINENKVRFILDRSDLEERDIEISELAYGSDKAKALFDDLMELAREELGVEDGPQPFMVEAIPMSEYGLVVNISRVENPDELDTRFSHFTNGIEYDHPSGDPETDEEGGPGFDRPEGPQFDGPGGPGFEGQEYDGPGGHIYDETEGPDSPENDPDLKQGPDGIQIQQGPEIRAEFSIPKSSQIDPKDIMSMIDNIVSGLAGKMGAEVRKMSGGDVPGVPGNPETAIPGGKPVPKKPKPSDPDPFALYEFKDLQSVIHASKLLSMHYDSENILYKNPLNQRYYLYLGRERNSVDEFAKLCTTLNEFGSRCRISYASKEYFEEHMTVVLRDALIQLEELA